MKKIFYLAGVVCLAACQAPYSRNVYQAVGPRMCYEYYDSFICTSPVQVWHETIYPKNESQMRFEYGKYIPYQQQSLNQAVYETM